MGYPRRHYHCDMSVLLLYEGPDGRKFFVQVVLPYVSYPALVSRRSYGMIAHAAVARLVLMLLG